MSNVEAAVRDARALVEREMVGRTQEGAMRRVESKYGIPYWTLWNLFYKTPKSITGELGLRIRGAWLDTLQASIRRDLHRLEAEIAKAGPGGDVVELENLRSEAHDLLARIRKQVEAA